MTEQVKPTSQDLTTISLAKKGGNDADLLLLDTIHEVQSTVEGEIGGLNKKINDIQASIPQLIKVFDKIELIQGKAGKDGETGQIGPKPSDEDLLALIQPLIPEPIPGKDGKNGKDGVGIDGSDGRDGKDAEPVDETKILAQITTLRDELEARLAEFEKSIKDVSDKSSRPIFGPGKTKILLIDLSSQLDGSTKTFFLGTHYGIVSVDGSSAPFGAFRPIIDYTESGKNIVFTANVDAPSALPSGQSLIVKVLK